MDSLILIVYEFVVWRGNLPRVLFGMKPLRRTVQPTHSSPLPQTARS